MRAAIALIVALAAAGPAGAFDVPAWLRFGAQAERAVPVRPVVSDIVEDRGEDENWIPGVVASRTQVTMAFQTLGRMTARRVDLGDRVREGEVLAELAAEDLAATTRAAEAALASAEVQRDNVRLSARQAFLTEHAAEVGEAVVAITGYSALVEAEAAIAFGALVKVGTDGKAITGTAADHCGRALGAATQAGQLIEVQLYKHVHA